MEDIDAKPLARDGVSSLWEVSFNRARVQSKGALVHARTVSDLRLLVRMKARYPLEGIEGAVVDLPIAQKAFYALKPPAVHGGNPQETFEETVVHDSFNDFVANHLIYPNPRMELFYYYRQRADELLRQGYAQIPEVMEYLREYDSRIDDIERETQAKREAVRHSLHHEVFFTEDSVRIKKRNSLLGKIMALENVNFEYLVPACPRTDADDDHQTAAEDINDVCQGISYGLRKKCASYFLYTKEALKDRKIMDRYFGYIQRTRTKLNILNFDGLDLYYPPDKPAWRAFKNFMQRIVEVQDEASEGQKPQFVLWGAGHQFFIALQAFDFVSSTPTRMDTMISWSKGRTQGYWYDQTLMHAFPPEDGMALDRGHCPECRLMRPSDFKDPTYNQRRRRHGIHDMDNVSLGHRNAIKSNGVGAYLRKHLSASMLSAFQSMILTP